MSKQVNSSASLYWTGFSDSDDSLNEVQSEWRAQLGGATWDTKGICVSGTYLNASRVGEANPIEIQFKNKNDNLCDIDNSVNNIDKNNEINEIGKEGNNHQGQLDEKILTLIKFTKANKITSDNGNNTNRIKSNVKEKVSSIVPTRSSSMSSHHQRKIRTPVRSSSGSQQHQQQQQNEMERMRRSSKRYLSMNNYHQQSSHVNSKQSVKMIDLINAGLLKPGTGTLCVHYKNTTYKGDLSSDGVITFEGKVFKSLSTFSLHVKSKLNPLKQGDDGWKSVTSNGQTLSEIRKAYIENYSIFSMERHDGHLKNHYKRQAPETIAKRVSNSRKNKKENASIKRKRIASTKNENISYENQQYQNYTGSSKINKDTQPISEIQKFSDINEKKEALLHWVYCENCSIWRVVPETHAHTISSDERDKWFCSDATWDVLKYDPFKHACNVSKKR